MSVRERIQEQELRVKDLGNKQVGIDNYLKKYLPYNTFVSFMEVMHVCLSSDQLKRVRDYEVLKLKAYYLDMLQDHGSVRIPVDVTEQCLKDPSPGPKGKLTVSDYLH